MRSSFAHGGLSSDHSITRNEPVKKDPEIIVVETPDHFQLELKLAGIGTRCVAFLIDRCIQWGLMLGLILFLIVPVLLFRDLFSPGLLKTELSKLFGQWVIAVAILVYGIITIGYFILFEYFWSGSTPGKVNQGIRVVRKDGRPVTIVDSVVRNVLRFVDLLADIYPFGLVFMFIDSKNRRLGDLAAGTYVVFDREARKPDIQRVLNTGASANKELQGTVAGMSHDDYRLVSMFLSRRGSMDTDYRHDLARKLHERIFRKPLSANIPVSKIEKALQNVAAYYREKTRVV